MFPKLTPTLRNLFITLVSIFPFFTKAQTVVTSNTPNNYTFTVPCGVTSIKVECWGGGGAGGSRNGNGVAGGGGGGAYASFTLTVVPGQTYTYVVGTGGSSGNNGANSYFQDGSMVLAAGGKGVAQNVTTGGAGGQISQSVGTTRYSGGNGGNGSGSIAGGGGGGAGTTVGGNNGSAPAGGAGGNAFGGDGGNGRSGSTGVGVNGLNAGGGGGGTYRSANGNTGGSSGAAGMVKITYTPVIAFTYCLPTFTSGTRPISFVNFAGIHNTSSTATSSPGYESFCSPEANALIGGTYSITLSGNSGVNNTDYYLVFIDFDRDGTFNTSTERFAVGTLQGSNGNDGNVLNGNITIPSNVTAGKTVMRVMKRYNGNPTGPCQTGNGYGQTEDYIINILSNTNCTGTPTGGTSYLSDNSGDVGSTFIAYAGEYSVAAGITYQWQSSPDGIVWTDIVGATNPKATITAIGIAGTTQYRLKVTCGNSGLMGYSAVSSYTTVCASPTTSIANLYYIKTISFIGTLLDITNNSTFSNSPRGYQNFTGLGTKSIQEQGRGVNIYIESNTRTHIKAWVDWNKDGNFDIGTEEVFNSSGVITTSTTFGFVIPAAAIGNYTIRFRTYNDYDYLGYYTGLNFGPCGNILNGETEDYQFTVVASCPAIVTAITDGETCGNGSVNLVVEGAPGVTSFKWYAVEKGGVALATTLTGNWTTPILSATTVYYVTALNGSCESLARTPITAKVSPIPNLSFSPAAPVVCGDGAVLQLNASGDSQQAFLINENFESGLGSFTVNNITMSPGASASLMEWQVKTSPYVPNYTTVWRPAIASGFAGNKFAFTTSDIANAEVNTALTSQIVNSNGFANLTLSFDLFYSHYFADNVNGNLDQLVVQVSNNGGAWTDMAGGTFIADRGIGTKFANITLNANAYINQSSLRFRFRYYGAWVDGAAIDNIKLYGTKPITSLFSWSPTTGGNMFTDAAGLIPYTGGSVANIYIKPTETQMEAGTDLVFTATATLSNGCSASTNITVKIGPSQWIGNSSQDWNNINNWCSKKIPTSTTVVEIPAGVPFYPIIGATASAKSIVVKSGASLTLNSIGNLSVLGNVNIEGTLTNNGKIILNGTSAQSFPGATATINGMNKLEIKNTEAGVILNKSINITEELIPTSGLLALGNFNITLISSATTTASVTQAQSTSSFSYGTGRFVVERYINIGNGAGMHPKSWQFLAAPVQSEATATIKANWQENNTTPIGYGTWLTDAAGIAAGFDASSSAPSMKSYNQIADSWVSVGNTNKPISEKRGYMVYIRGDRSVTTVNGVATSPTNMRIKGKIYDAQQAPPSTSIGAANRFESIGNPYASAIDFEALLAANPGLDPVFYVWDPTIAGSFASGGYQTFSAATEYKGMGIGNLYKADEIFTAIQSGQAFFVKSSAAGSTTVTFNELIKTSEHKLVNRTGPSQIQSIRTIIKSDAQNRADAVTAVFDEAYSNLVDGNDALKFGNSAENISLARGAKKLAVEARSKLSASDTLYYQLTGLQQQAYRLEFEIQNLQHTGLTAILIDKFLNTTTNINLSDSSSYPFTVTSVAASKAVDRFMMVFRAIAGPLPVNFISVSANRNAQKSITVSWKVANEINIEKYVVERSVDGLNFTAIQNINPTNNSDYSYLDEAPLPQTNFYRIKAVSVGGQKQYSPIVKVTAITESASINIYPNPVANKTIKLYFNNEEFGKYSLRLVNNLGQAVYLGASEVNSSNFVKSIELNNTVSKGTYQLIIISPNTKSRSIQIFID